MQIKFNNVLVLAGEWTEGTSDLTREVSTQVQESEFLRGTEPEWIERGNFKNVFRWKTQRTFESIVKAEMFYIEHCDNEGTQEQTELVGVAEFISSDGKAIQRRYARGKINASFGTPIGVHIETFYTLECGRMSKTRPTD